MRLINATAVQIVERLLKQLDTKKKELSDFQEKYKIRIKVGVHASVMLLLLDNMYRGLPRSGVFTGRG